MQFIQRGIFFKVVRITGPTHNLLSLVLTSDANNEEIEVEELHIPGPRQLLADDVKREACAGVEEANRSLGMNIKIRRIQFVPSDSGPVCIYKELAHALVHHYADRL